MFKKGDKFVVVKNGDGWGLAVGDEVTFKHASTPWGFGVLDGDGNYWHVRTREQDGSSDIIVELKEQTEAKKRGAKFGTMGVVKATGERCVYIDNSLVLPGNWEIDVKGKANRWHRHPSEIRLDHEPEFVEWKDAPEHLKYDASRVYYDGKPVKWIAKPEGAPHTDVVFTTQDGFIISLPDYLTVKL